MTETMTTQQAAEIAADWFETAKRSGSNEDTFTRLKDGAPEWITDLVRQAHGDLLPDDWRYQCIRDALEWIRDNDEPEPGDFADDAVDVYTGARIIWLGSNLQRAGYCDEAQSEGIAAEGAGVVDLIGAGQYMEASEVFRLVLEGLEQAAEELEEGA